MILRCILSFLFNKVFFQPIENMTVFEVECEVGGYYPDYIDWPDCEDPNPPNCTDFPAAPPGVPISIVEAVPQKPGGFVLYQCNDSSQTSTLGDVIQVIIQKEVSFCIFIESKKQPVLNCCNLKKYVMNECVFLFIF